MKTKTEKEIKELEKLLGQKKLLSITDLLNAGFYGSRAAALNSIRRYGIPLVKMSKHRFLVPREAFLIFLRENTE